MSRIDKIMQCHIRAYQKAGRSEKFIISWKRGWYMVGRRE